MPLRLIQARPGYLSSPGCMVMGFSIAAYHKPDSSAMQDLARALPLEAEISEGTLLVDVMEGEVKN